MTCSSAATGRVGAGGRGELFELYSGMKTAISIPDEVFAEAERGGSRSLGVSSIAMPSENMSRDMVRSTSPRHSTESAANLHRRRTLLGRPPDERFGVRHGDRSGRGVVGRRARAIQVGTRVPTASHGRAGGRVQSQSDRYRRVRAADQRSSGGRCSGQRASRRENDGLPKDPVANVSQIVTLDRTSLTERVGKLSRAKLELVRFGIDVVLGR